MLPGCHGDGDGGCPEVGVGFHVPSPSPKNAHWGIIWSLILGVCVCVCERCEEMEEKEDGAANPCFRYLYLNININIT